MQGKANSGHGSASGSGKSLPWGKDGEGGDGEEEPNALSIALDANSADCVQHILDAVLADKVRPRYFLVQILPTG